MAALAEDAGIAVTRRLDLGSTETNLQALKHRGIDLYPEYDGTGLVMLGRPAIADGDAAMQEVRALHEPLDLIWGDRLGFDNSYGLALCAGRAEAAISPLVASDAVNGRVPRAVRETYPGRRVLLRAAPDGPASVAAGEAPPGFDVAVEFVDPSDAPDPRPFEAIGPVGQAFVHVVSLGSAEGMNAQRRPATGPEGSASQRAATILATVFERLEMLPQADGDLTAAEADAAPVLATLGAPAMGALLERGRPLPLRGWSTGNDLVRCPQLRESRIPAGTCPGRDQAIDTLYSQLMLAGPVAVSTDVIGLPGPGATSPWPPRPGTTSPR